jgi:hypothetical protein
MNDRTSKMQLVQRYGELANSVPVRLLRFSAGEDSVPSVVDRLVDEFAQLTPDSDSTC